MTLEANAIMDFIGLEVNRYLPVWFSEFNDIAFNHY